jgi:hypothetical protein
MGLFDYTGLFKEDDEQAFIEQENRKLKEEADAEEAQAKAEEAKLAPPDFTKISNPQVRQYMMDKYQKEQELKEAKGGRDINAYASIAGRALEGLNQPTNIRYENSFKNLGNIPKRSVGEAFKYDNSDGEKYTENGIKEAEGNLAKVKADFNDQVAMDSYAASAAESAENNNPNSAISKQYQALAKELMPNGDFSNASAAKLKTLMPPLEKLYRFRNKPKAETQQGSWSSTGQADSEGYLILMDKNGNTKKGPKVGAKPGGAGEKPLPIDAQKKGSTAVQGMENELQYNDAINKGKEKKNYDPTSYFDFIDNSDMAPNFMKSDASIEAAAARDAWVENFLRDASGAAIPKDERKQYYPIYFPQPGDSAQAVENKRKLRKLKMDENAKMGKRDIGDGQPANTPPATGKVKVSNGTEILVIDKSDLQDAINDGFQEVK